MTLVSPLLQSAGFQHGFGTKGTDNYPEDIHILMQVHGERMVVLTQEGGRWKEEGGRNPFKTSYQSLPSDPFRFDEGDALVTDIPGTAVGIRTADCLPILVGDTKTGAVAAIHCGWRSLALGLAGKGVGALLALTGSNPLDLRAALGPAIGQCCYEVGPEVKGSFPEAHLDAGLFDMREDSLYMDLAAGAKTQMLSRGMEPLSIEEVVGCTSCEEDTFWSWRARKDGEERMISFIRSREP